MPQAGHHNFTTHWATSPVFHSPTAAAARAIWNMIRDDTVPTRSSSFVADSNATVEGILTTLQYGNDSPHSPWLFFPSSELYSDSESDFESDSESEPETAEQHTSHGILNNHNITFPHPQQENAYEHIPPVRHSDLLPWDATDLTNLLLNSDDKRIPTTTPQMTKPSIQTTLQTTTPQMMKPPTQTTAPQMTKHTQTTTL